MKKLLLMLLCLSIAFSLVACGDNGNGSNGTNGDNTGNTGNGSGTNGDNTGNTGNDSGANDSTDKNDEFPGIVTNGVQYALSEDKTYAKVIGYRGNNNTVYIADTYEDVPVKTIVSGAFDRATSVIKIYIPYSITSIEPNAFKGCFKLKSFWIQGSNIHYKEIDGNLYTKDGKTLVQYALGQTDSGFVIPDGVEIIGDYAFSGCNNISVLGIPSSVISIGSNAFNSCEALQRVDIPDSVTSIGEAAFADCYKLSGTINIPDGITRIEDLTFGGCSSLIGVTFGDNSRLQSIGDRAFAYCPFTSIDIPDSVTSIGKAAFEHCRMTSIVIPDSVESLGDSVFEYSTITSIVIPDSVTSLGNSAFKRCSQLTSITIPDSIKSLGEDTFDGCSLLASVTIPDSVESLGDLRSVIATNLQVSLFLTALRE